MCIYAELLIQLQMLQKLHTCIVAYFISIPSTGVNRQAAGSALFRPFHQGLCLPDRVCESAEPHLTDNDRGSIMATSLDRMSRLPSTIRATVCCPLLGHLQPAWRCVCQGLNTIAEKLELYCEAMWLHQFCKFSASYQCFDPRQGEVLQTR